MKKLEFKTTGDWNLQGNNKKGIYISLVAKINDWKKKTRTGTLFLRRKRKWLHGKKLIKLIGDA